MAQNAKNELKILKTLQDSCWVCGKFAGVRYGYLDDDFDTKAPVKLMACGKCCAIGRKVWYCSK